MSRCSRVVKTELSEIKEGSYIGVTAMPEPDGTQKAVAVHIFPENQRGAAEGFRPWDARAELDHDQRHRRPDGEGHRRPEHPGQVQGRREESRGAAGYADRHLRRRATSPRSSRAPSSSSSARRRRKTARWKPPASMSAATGSRRRCEACSALSQHVVPAKRRDAHTRAAARLTGSCYRSAPYRSPRRVWVPASALRVVRDDEKLT